MRSILGGLAVLVPAESNTLRSPLVRDPRRIDRIADVLVPEAHIEVSTSDRRESAKKMHTYKIISKSAQAAKLPDA
ncbi:uncharacterized protein BT62DRAFT_1008792 [Guyanagaster necrorhizus]|uniref:Uncharacterized protein n=1 Tax=Guyanagaster necrorhizus TaxID=856835 RepID=A0A9P7VN79_9AGAR|nr:uncharacterized protein BT62DRAFT_1008792 [Guyanagaster necrorhizus MCA 3950]KAG7443732.1 hypothetical protein BT62DRAFT_1008792 [Guyanagaster necrorhizus MCA 3950]